MIGVSIPKPILKRHPFSGRRELNTRVAHERDAWIESARHFAIGQDFWRDRCKARCERDGHVWVNTDDDSGRYCTCCGKLT